MEQNLRAAMRDAVSGSIIKFKDEQYAPGDKCQLCNSSLDSRSHVHVDHVICFEQIVRDFTAIYPNYPRLFADHPISNFQSQEYMRGWILHHSAVCQLRILCAPCNLKRPKK